MPLTGRGRRGAVGLAAWLQSSPARTPTSRWSPWASEVEVEVDLQHRVGHDQPTPGLRRSGAALRARAAGGLDRRRRTAFHSSATRQPRDPPAAVRTRRLSAPRSAARSSVVPTSARTGRSMAGHGPVPRGDRGPAQPGAVDADRDRPMASAGAPRHEQHRGRASARGQPGRARPWPMAGQCSTHVGTPARHQQRPGRTSARGRPGRARPWPMAGQRLTGVDRQRATSNVQAEHRPEASQDEPVHGRWRTNAPRASARQRATSSVQAEHRPRSARTGLPMAYGGPLPHRRPQASAMGQVAT